MTLMNRVVESESGNGEVISSGAQQIIVVEDHSEFANFLDTGRFTQLQRAAKMFAQSAMVPEHYRGKLGDCFIAMQMAMRLGIDPLMLMQNTHIVHGKPGMEGKLVIALINSSGLYAGPLQFRFDGAGDDFGCTAWAKHKETGEIVEGPKVTLRMVKAEGWQKNPKWTSMPDLMYRYRAGAFFGRVQCPERLMGMQTFEELEDVAARPVSSTVVRTGGAGSLAERAAGILSEGPAPEPAQDRQTIPMTEPSQGTTTGATTSPAAAAQDAGTGAKEGSPATSAAPSPADVYAEWKDQLRSAYDSLGGPADRFDPVFAKWESKAAKAMDGCPTPKQRKDFADAMNQRAGVWAFLSQPKT